jgi:hypothetical protein
LYGTSPDTQARGRFSYLLAALLHGRRSERHRIVTLRWLAFGWKVDSFCRVMTLLETMEMLSYVVTVVGLPLAILTFVWEQRKERQSEDEEIFQRLSDEYREFLKLVLDNADLHLLRRESSRVDFTEEQKERRLAIFGILISLFERAYLLVYEEKMDKQTRRMWQSWEDYMREWVRRSEFREALPTLLEGEDDEFQDYMRRLAAEPVPKVA